MKNWGSSEFHSLDPQFFDNPLITGVGQVWSWDDFKEALSNLLTADKKIAP